MEILSRQERMFYKKKVTNFNGRKYEKTFVEVVPTNA